MVEEITEKKKTITVPYKWSYGKGLTKFFTETKENKRIMGSKCPKCNGVLIPPVALCGRCYVETEKDWIQISDHGILLTWTTVYLPFPGQPTEPPYTYGLIKLDGADTIFSHLIKGFKDEKELKVGMRIQAVWNENRKGDLYDIMYFKPEEG